MTDAPLPSSFEEAIVELETIVVELERGQLGLEANLKQFERGVRLLHQCHELLEGAEARIDEFIEVDELGNARLRPFAHQASFEGPPTTEETTRPRRLKKTRSRPHSAEAEQEGLPF